VVDPPQSKGKEIDIMMLWASVADPGCLSRFPSRIPDPKTASKEMGGKLYILPFFVATNITKFKVILFLNW
jgi:hypothetical protein